MTKRKPAEPAQEETLLDADLTPTGERRQVGRVERRTYAAIRTARERGVIDSLEDPLAATALALARAIDFSETKKPNPFGVVAAARELREVMAVLQFAKPKPAGGEPAGDGELERFLEGLGQPDAPAPATS